MAKIIGDLKARLGLDKKKFDDGLKGAKKSGNAFGNAMKKVGGVLAAAFAFQKIFQGISKFIQKNAEFEQSLADLSAITGAVGKDLKYYEQQAKRIGSTTTLSASQAAKAFELMGSARPELLKNKEALAAVTEQAVILAEASGLDLPVATEALAKSMNQFNIPAEKAGDVINTLAAGSKEGAEAIPGLTEGIKVMGTAANMAGISLEESVGLIETLAEKGLTGAKAGMQLRNVILKLQSGVDDTNPAIVGMSKALENLGNKNLSATELTKMFGLESQTAAAILIKNADKFKSYTEAVTGTNVAFEQQSTKVDTIKGRWKGLMSAIEGKILVGSKFTDSIKAGLVFLTNKIPQVFEAFRKIRNAVVSVINYFIDLYNESVAFRAIIQGIIFVVKTMFAYVKMMASDLISIFVGVGQVIKDVFTLNFKDIGEHARDAFDKIKQNSVDFAKDVADNWDKMIENTVKKPHVQLIEIVPVVSGGGGVAPAFGKDIERVEKIKRIDTSKFGKEEKTYKFQKVWVSKGITAPELPGIQDFQMVIDKTKVLQAAFDSLGSTTDVVFGGFAGVIESSLTSTGNVLENFGKFFIDFIKQMIAKLIAATIAALALAVALSLITGGGGNIAGAFKNIKSFGGFFKEGFKQFSGFGMAGGGVVPMGYPNDTYPAMLTSHERVLTPSENRQYESGMSNSMDVYFHGDLDGTKIVWLVDEIKRRNKRSM